jgi:hypothetical protein
MNSKFDVQVRTVYRERWRRILVLSGDVEGVLIYNAMGHGERVYWNGRQWAKSSTWSWQIVYPFMEFELPAGELDAPVRIDVGASFFPPWKMGIKTFRFTIEYEMLYDERYDEYHFGRDWGIVTNEPYEDDY